MKKLILPLILLLCTSLIFCSCIEKGRNDLENLANEIWIEPQANVFSFEATDESTEESTETAADIFDESDEAFPVFSVTSDVVSDISGIISEADNSEPATDAFTEAYGISDEQGAYVWIPKSGKKYHSNAECSNMSGPTKVTVQEAEASGYTRCKRCY